MRRTKLTVSMTVAEFDNGYWYATDLKRFAHALGIPHVSPLRKDQLEQAIRQFLRTRRVPQVERRAAPAGKRDVDSGLDRPTKKIMEKRDPVGRAAVYAYRAVVVLTSAAIVVGCHASHGSRPPAGDAPSSIRADTQKPLPIVATDAELARSLEHAVERLVHADEFSGVVLLSRHGKPLLRRAYGFADREARRANTVDTAFALASVSKMFTAVVVAQLAERNLISLSATVGSLLPAYPKGEASSNVTVHHLLTMSSGIPDLFRSPQFWADVAKVKAFADFWPHFAHAPLDFAPGTRGAYSNSNFLVLGAIVEQVLGRPFIESVEQHVFRPAAMTSTSYLSTAFPSAALGYTRARSGNATVPAGETGPWRRAWDDPFAQGRSTTEADSDCVPCAPMGGGYSTADDLARFAEALIAGRLLGADMKRRALTGYVAATEYGGHDGYGFETRLAGRVRIAGHRGGFSGINNRVEFYPDLGYVLVALGNTDATGAETIAAHVRTLVGASPALSQARR